MKKLLAVLIPFLLLSSFSHGQLNTFQINGEILQDSLNNKNVILVTQVDNLSDTLIIHGNKFSFRGTISEPTNAALVIDGVMLKFPLVNDQLDFVINNVSKKDFIVKYENSKIKENLDSYFRKDVKRYEEKFKELGSLEVNTESDSLKMHLQLQKDSLSKSFLNSLKDKFSRTESPEGLPIIIADLIGLFGTKSHPDILDTIFDLVPQDLQNGYFGKRINTFLEQSYKIAVGKKVDFKFFDINNEVHQLSDYRGKLILLEFWATWCGPCIGQIPSLQKLRQSKKIELISVSIDDDKVKWKKKVPELGMKWINVHFKQDENLRDKFFISGVPCNILLSQDGRILRKNIEISELIKFLK